MAPRVEGGDEYEFCDVCRINHCLGRRHRYLPAHRRALAVLLARHGARLNEIRDILRHPALVLPEHRARCCLWCPFCAVDLREPDAEFTCANVIYHLASSDHHRSVKDFFRKHGGPIDKVDPFRVSETDLIKWEKACKALKDAIPSWSKGSTGPSQQSLSKAMRHINPRTQIIVRILLRRLVPVIPLCLLARSNLRQLEAMEDPK